MKFNTIFVAGVHGVGKGHFTDELGKTALWPCYSASALIKQAKNKPVDHGKVTIDAGANQDHLIVALNDLSPTSNTIILDGHFVLKTSTGYFEVPLDTFRAFQPKAVILLTDKPEVIEARLINRDGHASTCADIKQMQDLEVLRAKLVCNSLGIPLLETSSGDYKNAVTWIYSHI